jgi:uncharacterized protein (TIGR02266 family)
MIQANKAEAQSIQREERAEAEFSPVQPEPGANTSNGVASGSQRREHPRYKVELDVSLGSDHNFYVGFVENLSSGGVFIATHMLKSVGEVFELTVHLPNSTDAVCGVGEVRWIREYSERSNVPPGMGVRFISLEAGAEKLIEDFLARREPMFFDDD